MFTEEEVRRCRVATVDDLSVYDILEEHEIEAVNESTSNINNVVSCALYPNYNGRLITTLTLKKLMSGFNIRDWLYEISNCLRYRNLGRCWVS